MGSRAGVLLLVCGLSACISTIGATSEQLCAARGMQLDGVDIRQGSAFTSGWHRQYITDISTVDVRCSRPQTSFEQCKIAAYVKAMDPAADFNATVGRKNLCLALGYVAFVVPGVVLFFNYEADRDQYVSQASEQINAGVRACGDKAKNATLPAN